PSAIRRSAAAVIPALGSADRLVRLPWPGDVPSGTPGGTPAFDRTAASHACRLSGQAWLSDMPESGSSIRSLEPPFGVDVLSDGSVRSAASASEARSAHGCFLVFDDERVDAVLVVDLAAGGGRVEHAGQSPLVLVAHGVLLMTVEQVHDTVVEGVFLAGDLVGQRSLALHAVHGFDVVLVVERRGGPGVDHGVVEREADALLAQHHA